jgi:hypothetical protein
MRSTSARSQLAKWVERGDTYARSLPAKART